MPHLNELLVRLRESAADTTELGRRFEHVVKHYLENDPVQQAEYKKVWLWKEWSAKNEAHGQDTGIDLVAQTHAGELAAVQAKFYEANRPIGRHDVDTFLAASGMEWYCRRLLVSTTENWGKHADDATKNQAIPCQLIGVDALDSHINWRDYLKKKSGRAAKNKPKPHQREAIRAVKAGLARAARGKLIMACGTGKTYTALKIAEEMVPLGGVALFLAPSLSLVAQALSEWNAQAKKPLRNFVVCSDATIGRAGDNEDILTRDLVIPATTNPARLAAGLKHEVGAECLNVIFATYHSLAVIAAAQKLHKAPAIDLMICDEAHRTTGAEKVNEKGEKGESYYIQAHDDKHVRAQKRLYMTATPRIYNDGSKTKAKEADVAIYSMDDKEFYGEVLHHLSFSAAVGKKLLSDYKVIVLTVSEEEAQKLPKTGAAEEINAQDGARLIGCWNALSKRFKDAGETPLPPAERAPMRRAVMFANTIKTSKNTAAIFNEAIPGYTANIPNALQCEVRHIDGTMSAMERAKDIKWLRAGGDEGGAPACRLLTNAKCLSEGVDVPALDAVVFLHPRKSQVDVVQSVGRVMRLAKDKQYGYIILPIVIPPGVEPETALNENPNGYKVVWQVLQALRAHDERFEAMINQLELNKTKPDKLIIADIGKEPEAEQGGGEGGAGAGGVQIRIPYEWQGAILAQIVKRCGEKSYWENWAKDVAGIAKANIARIHHILKSGAAPRDTFDKFLAKLQKDLNPTISREDAVEMLAQHLITHPVFDALFEKYVFAKQNPVSKSMAKMIRVLEKHGLEKQTESLESFYASVRRRAEGIDNADGRQKVLLELYEKFFSLAFKKQTEMLGIVYTPTEVVDFILQSADAALRKEFGSHLGGRNVDILDPFTGTGVFIARLLRAEDPLIAKRDLKRKYAAELHANEITLLAYYIAAVNIEEQYHDRIGGKYQPFGGIVFTDTFQLSEARGTLGGDFFKENTARAKRQRERKIQVIIGNPPYAVGQANAEYAKLKKRIAETYVKDSSATNRNALYDSYIRAIRWASDRIEEEGIVAFVTNGSFINSNAAAGVRKHLLKDFSSVYCYDLRGNQRTSGEVSRREGGKIFGAGSRAPVAITVLVKKARHNGAGKLYYYDIGDYLSREEKLAQIKEFQHYGNVPWRQIKPNADHDWINQRSRDFVKYAPMGFKRGMSGENAVFSTYSSGIKTNRDAWVYDFAKKSLQQRMKEMIRFYNSQVEDFMESNMKTANELPQYANPKIKWDGTLEAGLQKGKTGEYTGNHIRHSVYRPFTKQWLYFDRQFNSSVYLMPAIFPTTEASNVAICVPGVGATKEFSALMVNIVPDLEVVSKGQCFPLYYYSGKTAGALIAGDGDNIRRHDNISDAVLTQYRQKYGGKVVKEDIFYYIYGLLHAGDYKRRYAADLTRMLPRIPMVKSAAHFRQFAAASRKLADLHLNYETAPEYPLINDGLLADENAVIEKMRFGGGVTERDKTRIVVHNGLTLTGIPPQAYEYQVNGKSPVEWIMDRYRKTVDKPSGIAKDPNQWSDKPGYIVSLLKRAVHVAVESAKIVKTLPELDI